MALRTPPIARSNMTMGSFLPSQQGIVERKNSVDSLASSVSGCKLSSAAEDAAAKADNSGSENNSTPSGKRRGKKGARQRVKKVSVNFTIVGSENKEPSRNAFATEKQPTSVPADMSVQANGANAASKDRKEDYWYYDQISDGFYYENNGSRGWRKRNEKIHGPPPSTKRPGENEAKSNQAPGAGKIASSTNGVKYDAASDGYFFEMASVDGWRRRQPEKAPMQRFVPKSNSTTSFQPLPNNVPTPPPAQAMQMPQQHGSSNQFTNAQLEEMIIRQHLAVAPRRLGSLFHSQQQPVTRQTLPSNASTTSSLSEDATSPPPPGTIEHSMFMSRFRGRQGGLQPSNSATNCMPTSVNFRVGSADENYEFYWSDTEKASSISSADDTSSDPMKESSVPRDTNSIGSIGDYRRPDSLNVPRRPSNSTPWWDANCVADDRSRPFDVDKFINDLPSFDDAKIYRAMMSETSPRTLQPNTVVPETSHSPLCTPLKNDAWWTAPMPANSLTKFASKDIKKIWQQPVA